MYLKHFPFLEPLESRQLLSAAEQKADESAPEQSIDNEKLINYSIESTYNHFINQIAHPFSNGWIGNNLINFPFGLVSVAAQFGHAQSLKIANNQDFKALQITSSLIASCIHLASHSDYAHKAQQCLNPIEEINDECSHSQTLLAQDRLEQYEDLVAIDESVLFSNIIKSLFFAYTSLYDSRPTPFTAQIKVVSEQLSALSLSAFLYQIWTTNANNRDIRTHAYEVTTALSNSHADKDQAWEGLLIAMLDRIDTWRYFPESYSGAFRTTSTILNTALDISPSVSLYTLKIPNLCANILRFCVYSGWEWMRTEFLDMPASNTLPQDLLEKLIINYQVEQNDFESSQDRPASDVFDAFQKANLFSKQDILAFTQDKPKEAAKLFKNRLGIS